MRAIGLAALTLLELPAHEQVSVAAQAGYSHVGLRLVPVSNQVLPPFDEREVERRLAATGVRVLDVEVFRLAPQTRVAEWEPVLGTAQRLGATDLLAHGDDPVHQRLVEAFGELCALAARYSLRVNLEPMPWVEVSTVTRAKRLIAESAANNAAVLIDAIHFFRADNRFEDIPHAMNYAQFCDAHPGRPSEIKEIIRQARSDRLFPGEGALELERLLKALPADLPLSLEVPVSRPMSALDRARRALEAMRRLIS
ncbi:MAG TPA: sugar phosphate isomerase/epimerase [Burkholderiales bacterium]|nr:sugar phosphate isomerase/epimerase [Burkholderiales bacterium]